MAIVDVADRYNVDMVYPQSMFPSGGDGSDGQDEQQQRQQQQQSDELLQRSDLLRQLQQQREINQQLQQQTMQGAGVTSPGLGPTSFPPSMNPQSMLAAGIPPSVIDAHQRRTQSILDAAIAAANQAGDARAAASLAAGSSGMGTAGMGGGVGGAGSMGAAPGMGGMAGVAGMGGSGMGYGAAGMGFQRPGAGGFGGYGQGLTSQQEALLQNRFTLGGAGLGGAGSYGGMVGAPGGMALMDSPTQQTGSARRKPAAAAKKRPPTAAAKKPNKKRAKTFPEKLMSVMIDLPNDDAVAWLPDGKSFVVVDPDLFVDDILTKVFKGCKYSSFVRKLHRWGFVRLTSGTGTDCFHHPLFQKNRQDLCLMITCTPRDAKDGPTKSQTAALQEKPPSLAGVEKFISSRAKKMAASAGVAAAPPQAPASEGSEGSDEA